MLYYELIKVSLKFTGEFYDHMLQCTVMRDFVLKHCFEYETQYSILLLFTALWQILNSDSGVVNLELLINLNILL